MASQQVSIVILSKQRVNLPDQRPVNSGERQSIKPQNILRCDDVWKIADFGISKLMNNPVTGYTFQGAFTAP